MQAAHSPWGEPPSDKWSQRSAVTPAALVAAPEDTVLRLRTISGEYKAYNVFSMADQSFEQFYLLASAFAWLSADVQAIH